MMRPLNLCFKLTLALLGAAASVFAQAADPSSSTTAAGSRLSTAAAASEPRELLLKRAQFDPLVALPDLPLDLRLSQSQGYYLVPVTEDLPPGFKSLPTKRAEPYLTGAWWRISLLDACTVSARKGHEDCGKGPGKRRSTD